MGEVLRLALALAAGRKVTIAAAATMVERT
jgi:hypothetical protein